MKKPKLLVVASTFPRWQGDADPPFVYELSKRLTNAFEVHVITPYYPGAEKEETIDQIRVRRFCYFIGKYQTLAGGGGIITTLKKNKLYWLVVPFFITGEFIALIRAIIRIKPDIIHAHWMLPQGFLAAISSFFHQIPIVVTLHGADVFALKNRLFSWMKSFTLSRAAKITVVSSAIWEVIRKMSCDMEKCTILPMGVDSDKFYCKKQRKTSKERKILYVGRLSEKKGVNYLLSGFNLLQDRKISFTATIVGHGELENELREKSAQLGLNDKVVFTGGISNSLLPEIYAGHDIFVGPSITAQSGDTEGFGLTFVEAGMSGCLLIGTNVGGITDIISHGETGLLIEQKDEYAIADAIEYVFDHPDQAQAIVEKSQRVCLERYNWRAIAKKYENLFINLAGPAG